MVQESNADRGGDVEDSRRRGQVGRVYFDLTSFDDAVEDVLGQAESGVVEGSVRLSNAWCVVLAEDDLNYAALLNSAGRTFPDGKPVADMLAHLHRSKSPERVRGPSLFVASLERSQGRAITHYFLGGTPETLTKLTTQIGQSFPAAVVVGSWSPPFGPVTPTLIAEAVMRVEASGANIVWVGLGSPKQDHLAQAISVQSGVIAVGVGAAFDFVAGTVAEAPAWVQRIGGEWLFRLLAEPRRLWKRYIFGNSRFMLIALRQLLRSRSGIF